MEDFEVPRHPKREDMGTRTVPFGKTVYIERDDFFDLEGPEGEANNNKPPKGYKRLLPNDKVRLRYAYVIECTEVIRDPETREPMELKCQYLPDTRAGVTPEGMTRVQGIIHWVDAIKAQKCTVNQYDRLFLAEEPGKESGDFLKDINPKSLEVISDVLVEPSVVEDAIKAIQESKFSSLAYQFERNGYFALDESSTDVDNLVFNRVVALRDTWGATKQNDQERSGGRNQKQDSDDKRAGGSEGTVEDVRRVAFRAATILSAKPHPEADSLLICTVDCGDVTAEGASDPRTVVAGLAGKIPLDELVGRTVVAVTNLKPSKMRGVESEAMLLAASNEDDQVELLSVPDSVPNGELISFEGKEASAPDTMLKNKGALKVWDRVKSSLRASDAGEALYLQDGGAYRMVTSQGPVKTTSLKNVPIQ
jgi:methionine--tRNA ligase beta chain